MIFTCNPSFRCIFGNSTSFSIEGFQLQPLHLCYAHSITPYRHVNSEMFAILFLKQSLLKTTVRVDVSDVSNLPIYETNNNINAISSEQIKSTMKEIPAKWCDWAFEFLWKTENCTNVCKMVTTSFVWF